MTATLPSRVCLWLGCRRSHELYPAARVRPGALRGSDQYCEDLHRRRHANLHGARPLHHFHVEDEGLANLDQRQEAGLVKPHREIGGEDEVDTESRELLDDKVALRPAT